MDKFYCEFALGRQIVIKSQRAVESLIFINRGISKKGNTSMEFLRSVDKLSHDLANSQARIFEKSIFFRLPSKIFIRSYMVSNEARMIDSLKIEVAGFTEIEIFEKISKKINSKNGQLYSNQQMHYIGYFYRMAAYLTGCSSKFLYEKIKPDLIYRNYETLHALSIEEAIIEVFEIANIKIEDKNKLFREIYRKL